MGRVKDPETDPVAAGKAAAKIRSEYQSVLAACKSLLECIETDEIEWGWADTDHVKGKLQAFVPNQSSPWL